MLGFFAAFIFKKAACLYSSRGQLRVRAKPSTFSFTQNLRHFLSFPGFALTRVFDSIFNLLNPADFLLLDVLYNSKCLVLLLVMIHLKNYIMKEILVYEI